jgi:hypothetical protein
LWHAEASAWQAETASAFDGVGRYHKRNFDKKQGSTGA